MNEDAASAILAILTMLVIFIIPSIVAFWRRHPNRWVILLLNIFLGATGIVWFGCLIWAFMAVHISDDPDGSNGGESGLNLAANDVVRVRVEPALATPAGALPPPLPAPARPDAVERLERLKRLRDDGAIDQQQFERMRDRIIAES